MTEAAEDLRFEAAAIYRDWIAMVTRHVGAPEDAAGRARRHGPVRLSPGRGAPCNGCLRHARRAYRRASRILLGRPDLVRSGRILFGRPSSSTTSRIRSRRRRSTSRPTSRMPRCWRRGSRNARAAAYTSARRDAASNAGLLDLVMRNAQMSFETRFRILKPRGEEAIDAAAGNIRVGRRCPAGSRPSTSPTSRGATRSPAWSCARTAK